MKRQLSSLSIASVFFIVSIVLITLYPFVYILAVSLSQKIFVMRNEVSIFPKGLTLEAYKYVLQNKKIFTAYYNTILLVVGGTVVSLFVTTMAAYALSKKKMLFHKFFAIAVIIPMFFQGGMIPLYLTVKGYGLLDTLWAIILPSTVNIWYLIIMRAFFFGFSRELEDSARIDGLKDLGVFWHIVLPLSKAVLSTIGLFYAVSYWNAYFAPLIYLISPEKFPLQLLLRQLLLLGEAFGQSRELLTADVAVVARSLKYATIIVSVIPIIIVYPFIQKHFVKGVMLGSVKG